MRRNKRATMLIFAFILLTAIIVLAIICQTHLNRGALVLENYIGQAEQSVSGDDWEAASGYADDAESYWKKTQKTWAMIIDHFEIDNIEQAMSKTLMYIDVRNKDLALGELSQLKMFISHIPKNEMPSLENIF